METEEDRQHQQLQDTLLEEVPLSVSHVATTVSPSSAPPVSMPIPVTLPELSSSSLPGLPTNVDEQMRNRLDSLRQPTVQK